MKARFAWATTIRRKGSGGRALSDGGVGRETSAVVQAVLVWLGPDTVTHIPGVRALGTQMFCKQVVARGWDGPATEVGA